MNKKDEPKIVLTEDQVYTRADNSEHEEPSDEQKENENESE